MPCQTPHFLWQSQSVYIILAHTTQSWQGHNMDMVEGDLITDVCPTKLSQASETLRTMDSTIHQCKWMWTVNPANQQFFHQYQNLWHTYTPEWQSQTETIYPLQPWITQVTWINTVPATLANMQLHRLWNSNPSNSIIFVTPALPPKLLLQKLMEPWDMWEGHYGPILHHWHQLDSWSWP